MKKILQFNQIKIEAIYYLVYKDLTSMGTGAQPGPEALNLRRVT